MTKPEAIVLLLCLFCHASFSQQPIRFERLGRAEGLSQNSVNAVLRDREGMMWFGTQDGLNQYDGRKFRVFQHQPGDSTSLSNNYIVSLAEDGEGVIWTGTMTGGLNRFDKQTGHFKAYKHADSVNSISENTVWTLLAGDDPYIWAGTSLGLNCLDKRTGEFRSFRPIPGDLTSLVTDLTVSLFQDKQGRIWVGTVEGLCLLNEKEGNFQRFINPHQSELAGANIIWSITQMPDGEIVTGTDNGVYLLYPETGRYRRILGGLNEPQLVAWAMVPDGNHTLWVASDRGLFRVDMQTMESTSFLHDAKNPVSIPDNNVWCLLQDPSGFLWAGTNNGICKLRSGPGKVHLYSADSWQKLKLSVSRIMAVMEDDKGFLWIGTDGGGLNRISPDRREITIFQSSGSGLRNDQVWALAQDRKGIIFIGNYQGGLHAYDPSTGRIMAYPLSETPDSLALSNRRVLALLAAPDGHIWIGTRGGGLFRLDPETGRFKAFTNAGNDPSGFPSLTVLSLACDTLGRVWAGTHEGGLALYNPDRGTFTVFQHDQSNPKSISDNNIWSLMTDSRGRLWAGTQGGLNVAENPGPGMEFRYFTANDGLRNNTILGIREDADGNIWFSSFSGLARLDIRKFGRAPNGSADENTHQFDPIFSFFDTDHGLQGLEFNQGASAAGKDGLLYFGGNNGLNYFSARELAPSNYEPPVMITGFRIFNREVMIGDDLDREQPYRSRPSHKGTHYFMKKKMAYISELVLSYRESVFSFEFASLDYLNPGKNQYAYMMEGFDENWNFMGTQNTATYTNLDPGTYVLRVRGSNSDGVWNQEERRLGIRIIPPFWQTGWFLSLSVIVLLLVFFMLMREYFIRQKRKAIRDKELMELQLKTIKSQMDPHFAFNAINAIASFIYADKPDTAYDYFTRFARMIRNILEDNEKISRLLSEEIEFVRNYLELQKMRFRDKFDYAFELDQDVPLNTPVPKMIIESYAENAIKHGLMHRKADGMLRIMIRRDGEDLLLVVEDNGIGREQAARLSTDSTHRGFRIMERTFSMYSRLYHTDITQQIEDLRDSEGQAAGTRVTLRMVFNGLVEERKKKFSIFNIFNTHGKA